MLKICGEYRFVEASDPPQDAGALITRVTIRNQTAIRWATHDLWEGVTAAIVRQVIRAPQARLLYQRLCTLRASQDYAGVLPPSPASILEMPAADFFAQGLRFQYPKLLAAARSWPHLTALNLADDPESLRRELQRVPGLGPWSIQIILADVTNDFSHYPHDDSAIRTAAQNCWPAETFPTDGEQFRKAWRSFCGSALSSMTIHALAFGRKP